MSASLVFSFPVNVTYEAVRAVIDQHFGDGVQVIPPYIKRAVETVGAEIIASQDNPANGQELNPAIAFGGLVNGGNVHAGSSAVAEAPATAPVVNRATSATTPPAPSIPAPPVANAGTVSTESAEPTIPASVDKTGLPWDARIHSSPAKQTDKGVWRKKRGVTDGEVATVEAELRALVGNGAPHQQAATGTQTASPVGAVTHVVTPTTNLVFADGNAKKQAGIAHAHAVAVEVAGPQIIEQKVLDGLLNGQPATLSPAQNDWFGAYFAKRNSAYAEFMNKATVVEPVTAPQTAAQVDATGLKWDARIHANPPHFDSAGVYVQRMDVAPEYKLAIMKEMRGNVADTASTVPDTPVTTEPVAPTRPVAPTDFSDPASSFPAMMKWIAVNQAQKRLQPGQAQEVAAIFGLVDVNTGVGSLVQAGQRPDLIGGIVETLRAYGAV